MLIRVPKITQNYQLDKEVSTRARVPVVVGYYEGL